MSASTDGLWKLPRLTEPRTVCGKPKTPSHSPTRRSLEIATKTPRFPQPLGKRFRVSHSSHSPDDDDLGTQKTVPERTKTITLN